MKIFKILGLIICIICLVIVANTLWTSKKYRAYSALVTCLESKPNDSETFGRALAVNNNYLAVGDPKVNNVAIYIHKADGNWLRIREISPPKNSNAEKIGYGFGADLALNEETLVIYSANDHWKRGFIDNDNNTEEVFATSINTNSSLQKIEYSSVNSAPISSLSFLDGNIALATRTEITPNHWVNRIYIADAETGKITKIIEPSELQDRIDGRRNFFDVLLDSYKNSLVVTYSSVNWQNFIYLISTDGKLKKISLELQESDAKKSSLCVSKSLSVSNQLINNSCIFLAKTWQNEKFSQPLLIVDYPFYGVVDVKQPHVLVSRRFDPKWGPYFVDGPQNLLMTIRDNKIVKQSYIKWSYNRKTYRSIVNSIGVIGEQDLFLSAEDGRVVRLPILNLPSSYQIEQNICGE
ncbi:MAG: hypothetical protein QNJ72_07945 [Pleurocapsa sp. MO_226.B13]|nr:hypothetical protein [Pleurocapsa sp. MO_226.B13]